MPPNRSRTTQWRRCLQQIHARNGAIEIAVSRHYDESASGRDLLWRVRLLEIGDGELLVEQPMALGKLIPLERGVELVGILAVGQNRWMFLTTNLGFREFRLNPRKTIAAMRIVMPQDVERCQRRNYYRVETAALSLPEVDLWPLLDPKSVLVAERANELQFEESQGRPLPDGAAGTLGDLPFEDIMPEVGPKFGATLMNLGGGGVGVRVRPVDNQAMARHKIFWLRLCLPPELETPICATGKLVHTHVDSSQHIYGGLAFDFSFNPGHQQFVVDQICRYIAVQQRHQMQRQRAG